MLRKATLVVACLLIVGSAFLFFNRSHGQALIVQKPTTSNAPTSQPMLRHIVRPEYPTYMEVVRKQNPAVAATQPLDLPLDLPDAAHLVFHNPVYLDPIGHLWITSPDGSPTADALATATDSEEHVIADRPVFVHWSLDDRGAWIASMVVHNKNGGFDLITKTARRHLSDERRFKWDSAFSVMEKIVVSTDVGVDVFDVDPDIVEHYHVFAGLRPESNPPVTLPDTRGLLAWSPWENNKSGSNGICRFVDGAWHDLPQPDWPAHPTQLTLLRDGTVLCMAGNERGDAFADQMHFSIAELEAPQFDDAHVDNLVTQLSDPDSDQRQAAFNELSGYGPALSFKLQKILNDQLPETRMRIRQLLRTRLAPTLWGMTPVDNRLQLVRRCADGTVIFFAAAGVQIPTEHDQPDIVDPAWLALRNDGRFDGPLPAVLVRDQTPEACTLQAIHDEWIINDGAGPRRLTGNGFEPILSPTEKRFSQVLGTATRNRWLFHDPAGDTLVIDPLIADPTPKLPAWVIEAHQGSVGWDKANFPVVSNATQAGNWELREDGWAPLAPADRLVTQLPTVASPASNPTAGIPLLVTSDGTRYFDGNHTLCVLKPSGEKLTWPLPAAAVGTIEPTLIQTNDGLLFLYNQPGRLLRIHSTPGQAEPFKLEATFTRDIPNTDRPARIWLDPAGRIDFVSDNILTVTFPNGHIPPAISRMMLVPPH